MNIKRILLIGLILVAVVASLSIVSADSSVKVEGFDFNIPEGYIENTAGAMDHESESVQTNDGNISVSASLKLFEKGNDFIVITVIEFDSPDDAKKVMDYTKEQNNGTTKTINGHEGIYYKESGLYEFDYCKDKYCIGIGGTDESLLEGIILK